MDKFIITIFSKSTNNVDYTTELPVEANTTNEAAIKAINWLTEQNLTIVAIIDIDKRA